MNINCIQRIVTYNKTVFNVIATNVDWQVGAETDQPVRTKVTPSAEFSKIFYVFRIFSNEIVSL